MSVPQAATSAGQAATDDGEDKPFDPVVHREQWLRRLADEYVKLETMMPVPDFLPDEGCPPWVENLEREVRQAMFPVAKLKKGLALTPQRLGGIIGHQCAIGVWMMEWLATQMEKTPVEASAEITNEQIAAGKELNTELHGEWYMALCRLAKRALASCVDQNYPDMRDFLSAYSAAFARKPTNFNYDSFGNSAFEVYLFMLWHWREIAELDSVRVLHEMLARHLGNQRAGDLKRTEKICQRIALHYRKAGRPKQK